MFTLLRALLYSALFIGFLLVYVPARILAWSGTQAPADTGALQVLGAVLTVGGAALAMSCILTFVFVGQGTPAPFDAPRRLTVRGPYRFVRNPMYVGAVGLLLGLAAYFESMALAAYAAAFLLTMHLLVLLSEEPAMRRTFGDEYLAYCQRVGRWLPRRASTPPVENE